MTAESDRPANTRPYVVLQEFELRELLESLVAPLGLDDNVSSLLAERISELESGPVYVKVAVTDPVKNAPAALRAGGQHMIRPGGEAVVVPGVAVPVSSWSTDDVRLTPRLDVEVGGQAA
jgi:hypothetical protein